MEKYKVDIRFPRQTDNDPDLILISGDEDNCIDCREELLNLEEEYVSDSVLDASNFDPNVYVIFFRSNCTLFEVIILFLKGCKLSQLKF